MSEVLATYEYTLINNADNFFTYSIRCTNGNECTKAVIPSTHLTRDVTRIDDNAFSNCSSLESIEIPDSVTSIGNNAFSNCISLKSVIIGNGVTSIDSGQFRNCISLESVTIGRSVNTINNRAFEDCRSLINITVNVENKNFSDKDGDLYNRNKNELIQYAIGKSATSFIIPFSVTSIGDNAFRNCSSLESIEIPDRVTHFGDNAFSNCSSLTKVNYTGTIDQWVEIGFFNYTANPLYYGVDLYVNDELVTKVKLTTATKIGWNAFANCKSLTSIEIPNSVTTIGQHAFDSCSSLESIEIPDSVTSIGNNAFSNCISLKSVIIGNGVTSIGDATFVNNPKLSYIFVYPKTPPTIGVGIVDNTVKIICDWVCENTYKQADGWKEFADRITGNSEKINFSKNASATKKYISSKIGDMDTVLDSIIALQNSLIGGSV